MFETLVERVASCNVRGEPSPIGRTIHAGRRSVYGFVAIVGFDLVGLVGWIALTAWALRGWARSEALSDGVFGFLRRAVIVFHPAIIGFGFGGDAWRSGMTRTDWLDEFVAPSLGSFTI